MAVVEQDRLRALGYQVGPPLVAPPVDPNAPTDFLQEFDPVVLRRNAGLT
jgi:hypothetical protein